MELTFVDEAVERFGRGPESAIPLLQAIQGHYRYLPEAALRRVCELTEITPAQIAGVSTFYDQFRHRPAGRHMIRVCLGTACHVKGAEAVFDAFRDKLALPEGEDTDPERLFTVEKVACLGCCMLAPAIQIDNVTYGHLTAESVRQVLSDFLAQARRGSATEPRAPGSPRDGQIRISLDTCCVASGSTEVYQALQRAVERLHAGVEVKGVGCQGISYMEPLVEIHVEGRRPAVYARVTPDDCAEIVARHFPPRGLLRRARAAADRALDRVLTDQSWDGVERFAVDARDPVLTEFTGPQKRIATEYCGQRKPTDIDEYLRHGGFAALRRCVEELSPEEVVDRIARSGLRGRGGAGYPSADKWRRVAAAPGPRKFVVCNGDEGDPGAFMDRMLLESQPYRVIEGMAIAARAVGASAGVVYIRAEYPIAVSRVTEALERCRERGFLGERVAGGDFRLELRVMEGAGAFVCGEETALLASIEGRRGMPRLRPPYPSEKGLWGLPTLVNNTETFSMVPWIVREGPEAFAAMGTAGSPGTKVFALAGKVERGGLIEVPMGVTLRQIVEQIGGGVPGGKALKAVQIGGPSGGCVPAALADTPIDFEALAGAGAMMGSGGMVVLDEDDCMVDIARYFLAFTQSQSCGKCTPCRVGTRRMLELLDRLCAGQARGGDVEKLEQLARAVSKGSLCGLGKSAPNPVISTLQHFRDEYDAHVAGRCPAGVCKALISFSITDDCIGCTRCAQRCPADAIAPRPYERHEIDQDKCVRCGTCRQVCPVGAVKVE